MSTSVSTYDGYTYVRTRAPVQVSFNGYSSDCELTKDVVYDDEGALRPAYTFVQDTVDTLTYSSSDPADEATWNVQYRIYHPLAFDETI